MKLESVFQRFKSVNLRNLSVFSRQFATLINSGMPMLRSLYTLEEQTEDEMLKAAIGGLRRDVEAGSSVAAAMESQPGVFDPLYRSMVYAGEGSGRLEDALERVAHQLEKLDALRRQVKSALMYPAVVFGLAMVVMIVVVAFIVPVFVGIFEELNADSADPAELPLMTKMVVGFSDFITGKWYIMIPAIGGLVYAWLRWKKTDRGRMAWDKAKMRIPAQIGDVVQKVALARWSRTFSGAVSSGVPILQAIELSGQTAGNAVIQDAMSEVYDSVKRGGTIARPLERHPVFPSMVSHMVSVGEESGQLEVMLEKIADFYDAEVDAKVKALTSLLEPIMIMVVGGIVGFIVIAMYLPIFQLYDSIR
jgi:type IV pilus assembly protein PilC